MQFLTCVKLLRSPPVKNSGKALFPCKEGVELVVFALFCGYSLPLVNTTSFLSADAFSQSAFEDDNNEWLLLFAINFVTVFLQINIKQN